VSLVEVMRLARDRGHLLAIAPTESGRRFVCSCACGWHSTTRRTEQDAGGAGAHHLRLSVRALATDGVSA
jgi:hypothetical protein